MHNYTGENLVYNACESSRVSDTVSEATCGKLQEKYNVEYLCKENNKLASNVCWVEEKK